jgi:hypothetical protein
MKNIFIVLFAVMVTSLSASCQLKVTEAAKKAFASMFPNATDLKWEKESADEYEANFKLNSVAVSANFKHDGSWVETETTIKATELPAAVTKAINTKYPGATYTRTEKIEKPGGKILYETVIKVNGKKKEMEVNADGSFAE